MTFLTNPHETGDCYEYKMVSANASVKESRKVENRCVKK